MAPTQSTDTPFAEPADAAKQPAQAAGEAAQDAEQSGDLESDAASTLASSLSTLKSEYGEFDAGVTQSSHPPNIHRHCAHFSTPLPAQELQQSLL